VGLVQAIVWTGVEVNGDVFFEGGLNFIFKILHKFCYPARFVVLVSVTDEDVVFVAGYDRSHKSKIGIYVRNLYTIIRHPLMDACSSSSAWGVKNFIEADN
jgi:hypothetical protein